MRRRTGWRRKETEKIVKGKRRDGSLNKENWIWRKGRNREVCEEDEVIRYLRFSLQWSYIF
jgi:hypothetical protein